MMELYLLVVSLKKVDNKTVGSPLNIKYLTVPHYESSVFIQQIYNGWDNPLRPSYDFFEQTILFSNKEPLLCRRDLLFRIR